MLLLADVYNRHSSLDIYHEIGRDSSCERYCLFFQLREANELVKLKITVLEEDNDFFLELHDRAQQLRKIST